MVMRPSPSEAVRAKAARIRLVLTDGGVWYSARGEEMKRFSMRDGMGMERLRTIAGIRVGIVTKESSTIVVARARKLAIGDLFTGVEDKVRKAEEVARAYGVPMSRVAYIGDDVNDLELLAAAGLSACPADAEPDIVRVVDHVCARAGGHGAFREFADLILDVQSAAASRRDGIATAAAPLAT